MTRPPERASKKNLASPGLARSLHQALVMTRNASHVALVTSLGSFIATTVTGAVCALPMIAILLGVGGFGWLTQYADWRVPASICTALALSVGLAVCYWPGAGLATANGCQKRRARRWLWTAVVFAVLINSFEYVVLPNFG